MCSPFLPLPSAQEVTGGKSLGVHRGMSHTLTECSPQDRMSLAIEQRECELQGQKEVSYPRDSACEGKNQNVRAPQQKRIK